MREGTLPLAIVPALVSLVLLAAPSPAASPSASPSSSPPAAASPSPTPARQSPTASPTVSPSPSPGGQPSPGPPASPTQPATPYATDITASAVQVASLTFLGTRTVATPAGPVTAMEIAIADATFAGLDIQMSCAGHARLEVSEPSASIAGQLTLELTWLQATLQGGGTVRYTPSAPPPGQPLGSGGGTLTGVTMTSVAGLAPQLVLTGATFKAVTC